MVFFKIIISIISVFLTIGFSISAIKMIPSQMSLDSDPVRYFFGGFVLFIPIWFIWMKNNHFYSTFEHELTHLIVGLLFLKKPNHFTVTKDHGGEIGLYGGNFLITLAPYFLPTFAFLMLPFYLIIQPIYYSYYFILFGFMISYHIFSTIQEFSYNQPDIIKSGKIFSTFFLIFSNIFIYGFLCAFIIGGFEYGILFLKEGILESVNWSTNFIYSFYKSAL